MEASAEYQKKPISYPGDPSEFEMQAYIMYELRGLGYDVRGEVLCSAGRLDLVVYDANRWPIRIIEVKKHCARTIRNGKHAIGRKAATRAQIKRYRTTGVTVDVVATLRNAKRYIESVRDSGGFGECSQFFV